MCGKFIQADGVKLAAIIRRNAPSDFRGPLGIDPLIARRLERINEFIGKHSPLIGRESKGLLEDFITRGHDDILSRKVHGTEDLRQCPHP